MTVIVDTSVLIDHLRGDERARHALMGAVDDGHQLSASVVTRVEVLAGMRPMGEAATRRLFKVFAWLDVDDAIAERAGELANRYLRSHPGVDPVDYIIAAATQVHEADLWTRNTKHFPMFPELAPPY